MAKTKALISCAVTAQLICVFVFAYAKSRFSHDEAHMSVSSIRTCFTLAFVCLLKMHLCDRSLIRHVGGNFEKSKCKVQCKVQYKD